MDFNPCTKHKAVRKTVRKFAETELGVVGRHTDIAGESLLQSTAIRMAVDGGDDGLSEVEEDRKETVRFRGWLFYVIGLHVAAGAKCAFAGASQDADAQAGIVAELLPDARQALIRFGVARV